MLAADHAPDHSVQVLKRLLNFYATGPMLTAGFAPWFDGSESHRAIAFGVGIKKSGSFEGRGFIRAVDRGRE